MRAGLGGDVAARFVKREDTNLIICMVVAAALAAVGAFIGSPVWAGLFGAVLGAVVVSAGAWAESTPKGTP